FELHTACDGLDALEILRKLPEPPDLILCDINTQNMNGLNALRSDPENQFIPVIWLSTKMGKNASIEEKEADDYLIKPFCARELIVRVRANIKLSCIRRKLLLQQKWQLETKDLLFSINQKIRSGFNIKETLASVVRQIQKILPSERVFIINTNSENCKEFYLIALASIYPNEHEHVGKPLDHIISDNDKTPSGVPFEPISETFRILQCRPNMVVRENIYSRLVGEYVSTIFTPIKTNSSTWGWLFTYRPPNSIWLDSEKEFVEQISNQIGLAITHATLMEEKLKKEAQMEAARAANEAKGQILANTSH
ncbi:16777_t:CDS:2, partial [Acaulospora morrowiae]